MMLENRVALITGASRGIGQATALQFAAHGAQTVLVARQADHLQQTCDAIQAINGMPPIILDYDVTDLTAVGKAFSDLFKRTKRLDILVNNAGILNDALLGMVSTVQIKETFAINVDAVIYHMQYAGRLMSRNKSGSIINVSSIIGRVGNAGQTVYAASKAAVIGATYSAAKELAPNNIRVNAIAPGFIATDMTGHLPQEKYDERFAGIKMGRVGTAEDVANVALFLASDLSSYVTGQVIGVDGGMLI